MGTGAEVLNDSDHRFKYKGLVQSEDPELEPVPGEVGLESLAMGHFGPASVYESGCYVQSQGAPSGFY